MAKRSVNDEQPADLATLRAMNEAQAEEIAQNSDDLEQERQARLALEAKVAALSGAVKNSVAFNPPPPPLLTRPEFKHDGKKMRFKAARFIMGDDTLIAEEVVKDKALLLRVITDAPGILEEIE